MAAEEAAAQPAVEKKAAEEKSAAEAKVAADKNEVMKERVELKLLTRKLKKEAEEMAAHATHAAKAARAMKDRIREGYFQYFYPFQYFGVLSSKSSASLKLS